MTDPNGEKTKYPSVKDAAEALGMHRQAINRYLRNGVTCKAGYVFEYVKRRTTVSGVAIIVRHPGNHRLITYSSISEAARKTGIGRQEINRYLSGEYKQNRDGYRFTVLG